MKASTLMLSGMIALGLAPTSTFAEELVKMTPRHVPYSWLEGNCSVPPNSADEAYLSAEELDTDGDGYANWEEYIAGSDPNDANSKLRIQITMVDHKPVLTWSPNLAEFETASNRGREYRLRHKKELADTWVDTTYLLQADGAHPNPKDDTLGPDDSRFYQVAVDLAEYLVIDVSAGSTATNYPYFYLHGVPEGGWSWEHKSDYIVLRRIPAGTFMMGSPSSELAHGASETQHLVRITKPFYIGVFEITQKQWANVLDKKKKSEHEGYYRPMEEIGYEDVIGDDAGRHPTEDSYIEAGSFVHTLHAKTGLSFDLPMEAEWEYACRAGTTTSLNNGKDISLKQGECPNLNEIANYRKGLPDLIGNTEHTSIVGSYAPNAWGLYDMHGNVWEYCRDQPAVPPKSNDPMNVPIDDPVSFVTILTQNVNARGGCYSSAPESCRAAERLSIHHATDTSTIGFRLKCAIAPIPE